MKSNSNLTMGQVEKKYHIDENGNIFKVNDDGSFTDIGNVSVIESQPYDTVAHNCFIKAFLFRKYNWLNCIALCLCVICCLICILSANYRGSQLLGVLSLCIAISAILIQWIFNLVKILYLAIDFLFLALAIVTAVLYSEYYTFECQLFIGFSSLLTFFIACILRRNNKI